MREVGFTGRLLGLGLVVVSTATAAPPPEEAVRLLDMYAKSMGEQVTVYIVASGDISQFKNSRKVRSDSYVLTLDVPALAPVDSKYDLTTPFTRRFEVWPMKLGKEFYSRVVMELELEASSVIGRTGPAQIYVKISPKSEPALAQASPQEAPSPTAPLPERPPEPVEVQPGEVQPVEEAQPTSANETPATPEAPKVESVEFLNLFPTPAGEPAKPTLLPPPALEDAPDMSGRGIRLGQFLFQPLLDTTYVWGDNLLLMSGEPFRDNALLVRGRAAFDLLDSEQSLRIIYDVTYRNFKRFTLPQNFSHFLNFEAGLALSPRLQLDLGNHLVRGSFESHEIDPGREVFFSVDPFFRNESRAVLRYDFSERLGLKLLGAHNHVQFLDGSATFYDYDTLTAGASFLFQFSALTSLFGEYRREVTPEPLEHPEAASTADSLFLGMTGEITPSMMGTVQAGYQWRDVGPESDRSRYQALVAEVSLTRSFSEAAQLTIKGGRSTFLSNFEGSGTYLSNHLETSLVLPLAQNFRFLAEGSLFDNDYPLDFAPDRPRRDDRVVSASAGLVYFFTPMAYLRGDYRYERRSSTLPDFRYRNNALQVLVGFGFVSR